MTEKQQSGRAGGLRRSSFPSTSAAVLLDQVLSSASNFLVLMAIANTSSVALFGVAALLMTILTTALAIARGGLGTPLMLLAGERLSRILRSTRCSLAAAGVVGGLASFAILVASLRLHELALAVPFAVGAPIALAQDVQRFSAFARGNVGSAVVADLLWTLASLSALVLVFTVHLTPTAAAWVWASGGLVSFIVLTGASRSWFGLAGFIPWWQEGRSQRLHFGAEAGLGSTVTLAVTSLSVWLIGTEAAAALRGASMVFAPLSLLMSTLPLAMVPHAVRLGHDLPTTWRVLARAALAMSGLSLLMGVAGVLLPTAVGAILLGDTWVVAAPVLPVMAIEYLALAWLSCLFTALKSQGMARLLFVARLGYSGMALLLASVAALLVPSATAMAAGLAIAAGLSALVLGRSRRLGLQ